MNDPGATVGIHSTVGEWVNKYPVAVGVFRDFEIDFCLGGFHSLQQVCRNMQLDPWIILEKLTDAITDSKHAQG